MLDGFHCMSYLNHSRINFTLICDEGLFDSLVTFRGYVAVWDTYFVNVRFFLYFQLESFPVSLVRDGILQLYPLNWLVTDRFHSSLYDGHLEWYLAVPKTSHHWVRGLIHSKISVYLKSLLYIWQNRPDFNLEISPQNATKRLTTAEAPAPIWQSWSSGQGKEIKFCVSTILAPALPSSPPWKFSWA